MVPVSIDLTFQPGTVEPNPAVQIVQPLYSPKIMTAFIMEPSKGDPHNLFKYSPQKYLFYMKIQRTNWTQNCTGWSVHYCTLKVFLNTGVHARWCPHTPHHPLTPGSVQRQCKNICSRVLCFASSMEKHARQNARLPSFAFDSSKLARYEADKIKLFLA